MTKDEMRAYLQLLLNGTEPGGYEWTSDVNSVRQLLRILIEIVDRLPEENDVNNHE